MTEEKENLVYEFFEQTSAHGLNQIRRNKPMSWRLAWFIVFILAFIVTVYGLTNIIIDYRAKPMASEFKIFTRNWDEKIPNVLICPESRFNRSKLIKYGIDKEIEHIFHFILNKIHPFIRSSPEKTLPKIEKIRRKMKTEDFGQILLKISSNCSELFEGNGEIDGKSFCEKFVMEHLSSIGRCFEVEGASIIRKPVALKFSRTKEKSVAPGGRASSGLRLWLVNPADRAFTDVGTLIPSAEYKLVISLQEIESVNNPPKFVCDPQARPLMDCNLACFAADDRCPCADPMAFFRRIRNSSIQGPPICDPWQFVNCQKVQSAEERRRIMQEVVNPCVRRCVKPCVTTQYQFYLDKTKFDPDILREILDGNETRVQEYRRSRAKFQLYVLKEVIHVKQYIGVTFNTVLSYLGGQIGLFLGCSLLTFVHFAMFCCYYGWKTSRKWRCGRRRRQPPKTHFEL